MKPYIDLTLQIVGTVEPLEPLINVDTSITGLSDCTPNLTYRVAIACCFMNQETLVRCLVHPLMGRRHASQVAPREEHVAEVHAILFSILDQKPNSQVRNTQLFVLSVRYVT